MAADANDAFRMDSLRDIKSPFIVVCGSTHSSRTMVARHVAKELSHVITGQVLVWNTLDKNKETWSKHVHPDFVGCTKGNIDTLHDYQKRHWETTSALIIFDEYAPDFRWIYMVRYSRISVIITCPSFEAIRRPIRSQTDFVFKCSATGVITCSDLRGLIDVNPRPVEDLDVEPDFVFKSSLDWRKPTVKSAAKD